MPFRTLKMLFGAKSTVLCLQFCNTMREETEFFSTNKPGDPGMGLKHYQPASTLCLGEGLSCLLFDLFNGSVSRYCYLYCIFEDPGISVG